MTAPSESERADAMAWLERIACPGVNDRIVGEYARTLKAMLAEPRMPEEPSDKAIGAMVKAYREGEGSGLFRQVYRALRAELMRGEAATKTVKVWRVEWATEVHSGWLPQVTGEKTQDDAERCAEHLRSKGGVTCIRVTGPHLQTVPA